MGFFPPKGLNYKKAGAPLLLRFRVNGQVRLTALRLYAIVNQLPEVNLESQGRWSENDLSGGVSCMKPPKKQQHNFNENLEKSRFEPKMMEVFCFR